MDEPRVPADQAVEAFRQDAEPRRRTPEDIHRTLRGAPWLPHVLLPHAVAVLIGLLLFLGSVTDVPGLDQLEL